MFFDHNYLRDFKKRTLGNVEWHQCYRTSMWCDTQVAFIDVNATDLCSGKQMSTSKHTITAPGKEKKQVATLTPLANWLVGRQNCAY